MARELTKLFETITKTTASELTTTIAENGPPKGEIVLLLSLDGTSAAASEAEIEAFLREQLKTEKTKAAANLAAEAFNRPKRDMYALAMTLKDNDE